MAKAAASKRQFGQITRLPSGRYRARYADPNGAHTATGDPVRHNGPTTFETSGDAEAWLADERRLISAGAWTSPEQRQEAKRAKKDVLTFGKYADAWLRDRDLKPRTREHYRSLLDRQLFPTFADVALNAITADSVRAWHALTGPNRPTLRAHSYGLLRTILATAERDELIPRNPAYVRAGGSSTRVHKVNPLTLAELETLVAAMPEHRRAMTLLAAWCAMRFGELAELRRKDVDLKNGVIHIRRAVVRVEGTTIVGTPKSDAGTRDVAIPPHLVPLLKAHIEDHVAFGKDALLFPGADGGHLAPSTLYGRGPTKTKAGYGFYAARVAAGRPELRWHDLRHTGAVLAASTGATLAELMGRLGHSTPGAAMRYQHAAKGRDAEIAKALSALVSGS
jgi:integrase